MFTGLMNTCALPLGIHTDAQPTSFGIHDSYYNYMNNPGILSGMSVIYWEVETASNQGPYQNTPPPDIISCHSPPTRSQEPTTYQNSTSSQRLPLQSTKPNQNNSVDFIQNFSKIREKKIKGEIQNKWKLPKYLVSSKKSEYTNNIIRYFTKWEATKNTCRKIFDQIWRIFFRHILRALEFNDTANVHFWVSSIVQLGNLQKMGSHVDYSSPSRYKRSKKRAVIRSPEEKLKSIQTDESEMTGLKRRKCKITAGVSDIQNFTNKDKLKSNWCTIGRALRNVGDSFEVMNKKQPPWVRLRVAMGFDIVGTILWSASLVLLSASAKLFFAQLK